MRHFLEDTDSWLTFHPIPFPTQSGLAYPKHNPGWSRLFEAAVQQLIQSGLVVEMETMRTLPMMREEYLAGRFQEFPVLSPEVLELGEVWGGGGDEIRKLSAEDLAPLFACTPLLLLFSSLGFAWERFRAGDKSKKMDLKISVPKII